MGRLGSGLNPGRGAPGLGPPGRGAGLDPGRGAGLGPGLRVWERGVRISAQVSVRDVRVSERDAAQVCPDGEQDEGQVCRASARERPDGERACGEAEAAQLQPRGAATTPSCRRSAYSPENKERYVYPYVTSSCADWTGSFLG